ncbi:MAG: outer membrane beta-barrel protein [Vicinamibacterales bacterium]
MQKLSIQQLFIAMGIAVAGVCAAPMSASAQTFITPFAGVTFNGDAPGHQLSTGVALTAQGKVAGFELEFGYTPDFFKESTNVIFSGKSNVTTLMGSLIVGVGGGPVRPYGIAGVGLLRTRIDSGSALVSNLRTSDFGVNAGFGLIGMVSEHVGLRGDMRYFRRLQDPSDDNSIDVALGQFDFWRAYGGVSFKF